MVKKLPETHILVFPNDMKVYITGDKEYLVPKGMSLVDENEKPLTVSEYLAVEVGKLTIKNDLIEFYIKQNRIKFQIVAEQLKMYVNNKYKCTVSYKLNYFSAKRKLWVNKNCIQIPPYSSSAVVEALQKLCKKSGIQWVEDIVEFMDDQFNFIQFKQEQDNVIFNRSSRFITALAKLDYYPQKQALFTGQQWINISTWLNSDESFIDKDAKLEQLDALFDIPDVSYNVRYLCGYPHCHGYGSEQERTAVQCKIDGCGLMFHRDCALFMDKNFNTEAIECPLHYKMSHIKLGKLPTFQELVDEYDVHMRNYPARPQRTDLQAPFKTLKLTRKEVKHLQTPLVQQRMNRKVYETLDLKSLDDELLQKIRLLNKVQAENNNNTN